MPVIPALRMLRQKYQELKANLGYIVRPSIKRKLKTKKSIVLLPQGQNGQNGSGTNIPSTFLPDIYYFVYKLEVKHKKILKTLIVPAHEQIFEFKKSIFHDSPFLPPSFPSTVLGLKLWGGP
jgi:hypothetical protein